MAAAAGHRAPSNHQKGQRSVSQSGGEGGGGLLWGQAGPRFCGTELAGEVVGSWTLQGAKP